MYFAEPVFINVLLQSWKQRKFSYKSISRPNHGLLYLYKGKITYSLENGKAELEAGDIVYLPKGSNYEALFDIEQGEIKDYLINFDVSGQADIFEYTAPTVLLNDRSGSLLKYFSEAAAAFDRGEPYLARASFYMCLHSVLNVLSKKADTAQVLRLKRGAELLSENNGLCVDEIAQRLNMSRSAFQKGFRSYFGKSPAEYRIADRINKACRLLEATDMPIKEIAYTLGFYDVAYFYRSFEKHCLMTPKKYREEMKREEM